MMRLADLLKRNKKVLLNMKTLLDKSIDHF